MLSRSLELCAGATSGKPEALAEMHRRATSHDRDHLNIEPRFYDSWMETIIATAKDFDEETKVPGRNKGARSRCFGN